MPTRVEKLDQKLNVPLPNSFHGSDCRREVLLGNAGYAGVEHQKYEVSFFEYY